MIYAVTADQMRRIDELAVGKYGILLEEMMELTGFHLASLARKVLDGSLLNKSVVVLAGKGNNGGGGLVAVRYLNNWGAKVAVILSQETVSSETVSARLQTLKALEISILYFESELQTSKVLKGSELVIDSLIGYGLKGDPKYPLSEIIEQANAVKTPILSLDLPSGLDATTGKIYNPCITAERTLTLALPKKGLLAKEARKHVGNLYLGDIGIPPDLYREMGIEIRRLFKEKAVVRLY